MRTRRYRGGKRRTLKAGRRKSYKGGRKQRRGGRKQRRGTYKGGNSGGGIVGANTLPLYPGGVEPGILCPHQYGQPSPRVQSVMPLACGTA